MYGIWQKLCGSVGLQGAPKRRILIVAPPKILEPKGPIRHKFLGAEELFGAEYFSSKTL